ncbi:MAG TPA: hypothetical protein VL588_02720 [Bdellovibrionota bacterium]|jgi:hypothetical protein|nr:hypothetical protein [Bdellovibrionota bacterium]
MGCFKGFWLHFGFASCLLFGVGAGAPAALADEVRGEAIAISGAPSWVTDRLLDRVAARVEREMEWDIRRVHGAWFSDENEFAHAHGLGSSAVMAVTRRSDQTIFFGPKVTRDRFQEVLAHELTHVCVYQKYKDAIPDWLAEGLANHVAKAGVVDYAWLATQPFLQVDHLGHPFQSPGAYRQHYMASGALMDLLKAKCNWHDLLQLSVGKRLETYIQNTCGISNLNDALRRWISQKAAPPPQKKWTKTRVGDS